MLDPTATIKSSAGVGAGSATQSARADPRRWRPGRRVLRDQPRRLGPLSHRIEDYVSVGPGAEGEAAREAQPRRRRSDRAGGHGRRRARLVGAGAVVIGDVPAGQHRRRQPWRGRPAAASALGPPPRIQRCLGRPHRPSPDAPRWQGGCPVRRDPLSQAHGAVPVRRLTATARAASAAPAPAPRRTAALPQSGFRPAKLSLAVAGVEATTGRRAEAVLLSVRLGGVQRRTVSRFGFSPLLRLGRRRWAHPRYPPWVTGMFVDFACVWEPVPRRPGPAIPGLRTA